MNETDLKLKDDRDKNSYELPLVNFTFMDEKIKKSKFDSETGEAYAYLFPRWTALSKA